MTLEQINECFSVKNHPTDETWAMIHKMFVTAASQSTSVERGMFRLMCPLIILKDMQILIEVTKKRQV